MLAGLLRYGIRIVPCISFRLANDSLRAKSFARRNAGCVTATFPKWRSARTYLVDALRGIMIQGGQSVHPLLVDLGVMAMIFLILASIAAKLYPTLVQ